MTSSRRHSAYGPGSLQRPRQAGEGCEASRQSELHGGLDLALSGGEVGLRVRGHLEARSLPSMLLRRPRQTCEDCEASRQTGLLDDLDLALSRDEVGQRVRDQFEALRLPSMFLF